MQRARRFEVWGEHFGKRCGSALRRPLINMLMYEWDKAEHGAPKDSLMKKLIPLM